MYDEFSELSRRIDGLRKGMTIKRGRGKPIDSQQVVIGIAGRMNPDLGSEIGIPYGTSSIV